MNKSNKGYFLDIINILGLYWMISINNKIFKTTDRFFYQSICIILIIYLFGRLFNEKELINYFHIFLGFNNSLRAILH